MKAVEYYVHIGFEVHIRLATKTKMFCSCSTEEGEPNTHICPVCLGYPGALPVPNKEAFKYAIKMAKALNGKINKTVIFARKNYFYPDLPKGYQITQHEPPLMEDGYLVLAESGKKIRIIRLHVEEDAAKTLYDSETGRQGENAFLMVDYNRSGVPLAEIVSYPDIHDPDEGVEYLKTLQALARYLGVSEANMEKGEMRADVNISVSTAPDKLGTKVEIKNMNSFKAIHDALEYEIQRQIHALETGETIYQETRMWDEASGKTLVMRRKETSDDYRYFPEPDIPPFELEQEVIDIEPEFDDLHKLYKEVNSWNIDEKKVGFIVYSPEIYKALKYLIEKGVPPKFAVSMYLDEIKGQLEKSGLSLEDRHKDWVVYLHKLISDGKIDNSIAKKIIRKAISQNKEPKEIYEAEFSGPSISEEDIRKTIRDILAKNPDIVQKYKDGKKSVFGFLMGQCMKAFGGKVPAATVKKLLGEELERV
ncbi:MAG: Asp-tRNA(Asn)/Glu-tRNA(Gln) amidotransferase subunit GatB [Dictyoglomi bacterium]|nr:Asp-tRNA(Asn)/Glu-tRNA(Gln) amidotransferase subunit GatB [Dictyoglomota bacterium]